MHMNRRSIQYYSIVELDWKLTKKFQYWFNGRSTAIQYINCEKYMGFNWLLLTKWCMQSILSWMQCKKVELGFDCSYS